MEAGEVVMELELTSEEARVLGCLVEKELSTPEYYPLSLNGLVSACNQKSARDPVMALDVEDVADALEELRHLGLALQAATSARVPRYGHNLKGKLHLDDAHAAVLCELLLRGPQTAGELRGRASRLHAFGEVGEIERILEALATWNPPLVTKLARRPGHKEPRYAHLLGDEPPVEEPPPPPLPVPPAPSPPTPAEVAADAAAARAIAAALADPPPARDAPPVTAALVEAPAAASPAAGDRLARLEQEVSSLRAEVAALRRELQSLRARLA